MFATVAHCPLGLELVCADEIESLGLTPGEVLENQGIVSFEASLDDLFRANLRLRCVERLSVTLAEFEVRRFDNLIELTADIPWERWIDDRRRLLLRVTSRGSNLPGARRMNTCSRTPDRIIASDGTTIASGKALAAIVTSANMFGFRSRSAFSNSMRTLIVRVLLSA